MNDASVGAFSGFSTIKVVQSFFREPFNTYTTTRKKGIQLIDEKRRHGVFSFNELITTDLDSAKKFYGELLGWSFKETKTIYGNRYLVALKDGAMVAGMMLKEGNVPDDVMPCWDPYITVDDVEKSAKIVEKMGARASSTSTS